MSSFHVEDSPTLAWPPPSGTTAGPGSELDALDLSSLDACEHDTIVMPAIVFPIGGSRGAEPPDVIEAAEPAPQSAVESAPASTARRLTLAALRGLPARTRSLPPAPPEPPAPPSQADVVSMQARIQGIPIVAIGSSTADSVGAPHAPGPDAAQPESLDESRAQLDSLAPTSDSAAPFFPVHTIELPAHKPSSGRWLRAVAACAFFGVLLIAGALRATGRIGPGAAHPATTAGTTQAPRVAPPPPAETATPVTAEDPAVDSADDADTEQAAAPSRATPRGAPRATSRKRKVAAEPATNAENEPAHHHDVQVDSLFYGHSADERSVTLHVDGKSVILREGDVSDDLQVQKILPDGVIFRQNGRLFAVYGKR